MKPGTPGFIGQRLREAREARGFKASELANVLDVTRAAVSGYELGKQTPGPDTMRRIEEVLKLPTAFFLRPVLAGEIEEGVFWWRSQSAATQRARLSARRRCGWFLEVIESLGNHIAFQELDFPSIDLPMDPVHLSDEMIEEAATLTRRAWGLGDGPISNVIWLLENRGILVAAYDLDAEPLSGFSTWIDGRPVVVVNASQVSVRMRFSAAHELGHLILHRMVAPRRLGYSEEFKMMEEQANRFSAAFLLPAATFSTELYTPGLDAFRVLKERWKVSIQTMISRSIDLGLVDEEKGTRLWKQLSKKRWRKSEPLDDEIPREEPRLVRQALEALKQHDPQIALRARDELVEFCRASDIEELGSLPRGFLDFENQHIAQVIQFPTQRAPDHDPADAERRKP